MEQMETAGCSSGSRRRLVRAAVLAGLVVLVLATYWQVNSYLKGRALVMADPDAVPSNPELLSYANAVGASAYASNCASCHGADLKGKLGVPNLSDGIWLYDYARVTDTERIVLYGIRSGNSKAHNVTDMPALG